MENKTFEEESIIYEKSLNDEFKKNNGIFYTDSKLATAMVELLNIPLEASIIDPCCGTGSFIDILQKKGYEKVYGCDFDDKTVRKCRALTHSKKIRRADTLGLNGSEVLKKVKHGRFNYVIGNPPYAPLGKDVSVNAPEEFIKTVRDSGSNLFIAAIYRAFELAKEDGIISFIIPKNLLHISSYRVLREKLLKEKTILSIVELGIHFKTVRGEQIILTLKNRFEADNYIKFGTYDNGKISFMSEVPQQYYDDKIIVFTDNGEVPLYDKLKKSYGNLEEVCAENIRRGRNKSKDAVTGKQIRKFGFKDRELPENGNQIFIQNIFSAEAGITASFGGNLNPAETVTIVKMQSEELCKYVLGLLHSRVCNYFLIRFEFNNSRLTIHTDAKYLNNIPIVVDNIAMEEVVDIVNKMEEVEYMSAEWFELNETLNAIVYDIYNIEEADRAYIEAEMRKISARKWYGEKSTIA